jgi:hypothetical protein
MRCGDPCPGALISQFQIYVKVGTMNFVLIGILFQQERVDTMQTAEF